MTRNLYQPRSYWAPTHLLISGLNWSWGTQTGELMCCFLNLKSFFYSRSCLHQAVTPATLLLKSSQWLLLLATGPESSLNQSTSLGTMILVHRGLFANVSWSRASKLRSKYESQQCCPLAPSSNLVKNHMGSQITRIQGDVKDQGECALAN